MHPSINPPLAIHMLPATLAIFLGGFALCAVAAAVCWWLAERPYFARKS